MDSSNHAIIGKTLDGTIISRNPGAERIYGYRADEMIGRPSDTTEARSRPLARVMTRAAEQHLYT